MPVIESVIIVQMADHNVGGKFCGDIVIKFDIQSLPGFLNRRAEFADFFPGGGGHDIGVADIETTPQRFCFEIIKIIQNFIGSIGRVGCVFHSDDHAILFGGGNQLFQRVDGEFTQLFNGGVFSSCTDVYGVSAAPGFGGIRHDFFMTGNHFLTGIGIVLVEVVNQRIESVAPAKVKSGGFETVEEVFVKILIIQSLESDIFVEDEIFCAIIGKLQHDIENGIIRHDTPGIEMGEIYFVHP